jgi:hypothetical protein
LRVVVGLALTDPSWAVRPPAMTTDRWVSTKTDKRTNSQILALTTPKGNSSPLRQARRLTTSQLGARHAHSPRPSATGRPGLAGTGCRRDRRTPTTSLTGTSAGGCENSPPRVSASVAGPRTTHWTSTSIRPDPISFFQFDRKQLARNRKVDGSNTDLHALSARRPGDRRGASWPRSSSGWPFRSRLLPVCCPKRGRGKTPARRGEPARPVTRAYVGWR